MYVSIVRDVRLRACEKFHRRKSTESALIYSCMYSGRFRCFLNSACATVGYAKRSLILESIIIVLEQRKHRNERKIFGNERFLTKLSGYFTALTRSISISIVLFFFTNKMFFYLFLSCYFKSFCTIENIRWNYPLKREDLHFKYFKYPYLWVLQNSSSLAPYISVNKYIY